MASQEFTDFTSAEAAGGSPGDNEKSQPPPLYNPTSYGYDQPGDGISAPKSYRDPTNYGYNQPGVWDTPYGVGQPGYGYDQSRSPYVTQPYSASSQTTVVVNNPSSVVASMRESTPPPDTTCGLITSILSLIFCGWPCGIAAIVYNRKARTFVDVGQHENARSALRTMWVWIFISVISGIGAWIYFGFQIKFLLDKQKDYESDHNNDYFG